MNDQYIATATDEKSESFDVKFKIRRLSAPASAGSDGAELANASSTVDLEKLEKPTPSRPPQQQQALVDARPPSDVAGAPATPTASGIASMVGAPLTNIASSWMSMVTKSSWSTYVSPATPTAASGSASAESTASTASNAAVPSLSVPIVAAPSSQQQQQQQLDHALVTTPPLPQAASGQQPSVAPRSSQRQSASSKIASRLAELRQQK